MKLSILIPMYNAEKYIGRCLESILNQEISEDEYEIIIMDDGSTDNSVGVVEQFKKNHSNINLYKEKNVGAYSTRNKLLKLVKGTYVYCLDADDYLVHNSLKKILDFADDNNLEIIGFETIETIEENNIQSNFSLDVINQSKIITGPDFFNTYPKHRFEIWWYLVSHAFLKKHHITFDTNEHNADVLFTLRSFMNAKRTAYIPLPIHRYFQSPDSIMRNVDTLKRKKLLVNFYNMIVDFNTFIISTKRQSLQNNDSIIEHLVKRRDNLVYTFIFLMLQSKITFKTILNHLNHLKLINAYPIKNAINSGYSSNYIYATINNKHLLFPFTILYRGYRRVNILYGR